MAPAEFCTKDERAMVMLPPSCWIAPPLLVACAQISRSSHPCADSAWSNPSDRRPAARVALP